MHSAEGNTGMGSVIPNNFFADTLDLENVVFNGETGRDIIGKESVIRNVLHLDRKNNT